MCNNIKIPLKCYLGGGNSTYIAYVVCYILLLFHTLFKIWLFIYKFFYILAFHIFGPYGKLAVEMW